MFASALASWSIVKAEPLGPSAPFSLSVFPHTVVWVNTKSRIYHFAGTHSYGTTKEGAYMCEADARAAGDRAAMNEHHP
jgi:hypothetical protein